MTTTNKAGVSFTAKEVASIAEIKRKVSCGWIQICSPPFPEDAVERQADSRSHQPLLDGARARDDFGDVLSFGLELGLRLVEGQSMVVGFIVPPVPIAPSCST